MALAGDFLSPSVASTVFKGEQMVAALNAAGLDFATFGNHEFDFGIDVLAQRMSESRFQWVVSNVLDARTGKAIGNSVPYVVRDIGSLKVGFIGLCLTSAQIAPEVRREFPLCRSDACRRAVHPGARNAAAPPSSSPSRT